MMHPSRFGSLWRSEWATAFGMSRISRPGEGKNTLDVVRIAAETAQTPELAISLTRGEGFGDVVCPVPEAPAWYLTLGAGGIVWSGGTEQRPTDGKPGDRGLYCSEAGARVHLYGSNAAHPGRLILNSATAAATPENVVVNGGTAKVSRVGDHARGKLRAVGVNTPGTPPTFTLTLQVVNGTAIETVFAISGVGTVTVPMGGGTKDTEIDSELFEGAEHFLG